MSFPQSIYPGYVKASASYILDTLTSQAIVGAYSLRKLRSAYAGSACQIKRSSDSTTQNIGFTAGGDFDSTAATTFVGAGTGTVTTWYDQSGNGYNASQATTPPYVILSGTLQTAGTASKATITASYITLPLTTSATVNFSNSATDVTCSTVCANTDAGASNNRGVSMYGSSQTVDYNNASSGCLILIIDSTHIGGLINSGTPASASFSGSALKQVALLVSGLNYTAYVDSAASATQSRTHTYGASSTLDLMGSGQGAMQGMMSEVIIHNAALSSGDQTLLWGNQQTYYGA